MKIHCVGPGSIGSLLSFHLHPISPVTLLLRRRQPQHRRSSPTLSIQIEREHKTRIATGLEYELLNEQKQQPIDSLLVTTKSPHVLQSLLLLRHRLSSYSTVVLLHNGLGVMEELIDKCFQDPASRPSFLLAITSHGVHRLDRGSADLPTASHGRFCHAGIGDIRFGVLPNESVINCLKRLSAQTSSTEDPTYSSPSTSLNLSYKHNPILNPKATTKPNLENHLPYIYPETQSLYDTISCLLEPTIVQNLNTKWVSMADLQTAALIKLAVNAAINPISALLETRNEAFHKNPLFSELSALVCEEASSVFEAQSGQPLRPHHLLSASNLQRVVKDIVWGTGSNISSMCNDMRILSSNHFSPPNTLSKLNISRISNSKPPLKNPDPTTHLQNSELERHDSTEIDYINGYICRLGAQFGIKTNVNETLMNLVKLKAKMIKSAKVLPSLQKPHRKLKIDWSNSDDTKKGTSITRSEAHNDVSKL
ncbi:hypothetical protein O181_021810 [Austropuccinia psidii MF-1]|uniref:2-dehydropantoate 2-reductase n=1 Tax=Austropuccinia psidii MF-1 TaxID=1389203 RepID=A0A9Q3GXG5_9BASI|nr:hypothetical protein [Austropuccinia psidii MF-1]